jgi:hypothetical protein
MNSQVCGASGAVPNSAWPAACRRDRAQACHALAGIAQLCEEAQASGAPQDDGKELRVLRQQLQRERPLPDRLDAVRATAKPARRLVAAQSIEGACQARQGFVNRERGNDACTRLFASSFLPMCRHCR